MNGMLTFAYKPLETGKNGELTRREFDYYMNVSAYPAMISAVLLEPLQEKMKKSGREKFECGDIIVTKSDAGAPVTRWAAVYGRFDTFLSVRADDSRANGIEGLKKFEGIGYCIAVKDLLAAINRFKDDATSSVEYVKLNWPRMKKGEGYPREISIPTGKLSIDKPDVLKTALRARRFCAGIKDEVFRPYEEANRAWFTQQTGYSAENPPGEEDSPVTVPRELAKGSYIVVSMERVQEPDYRAVFDVLIQDLESIAAGSQESEFWRDYRRTDSNGVPFVNIKRVRDRLLALYKEKMKDPKGRLIIVPKASAD